MLFLNILSLTPKLEQASLSENRESLSPVHVVARSNFHDILFPLVSAFPSLVLLKNSLKKTGFFYMKPSMRSKIRGSFLASLYLLHS